MNGFPVQTKGLWRPTALRAEHAFPRAARHYVPILQPHRGEMQALRNLPVAVRSRITPLIEIATMKGEASDISPRSPLSRVGETLQHAVGADEPFFLDFHAHINRSVVFHVLRDCQMHGLNFVPVIRPERVGHVRPILQAVGRDRGVALRVAVSPFTPSGMGLDDLIHELLDETGVDQAGADLFLDLGHLQGLLTAQDVAAVVSEVSELGGWRNFAISGTTMPKGFGQDQFKLDAATILPRREWELHVELRAQELARFPTYSDYGVQGAGRPNKGFRPIPNLRYTADTHTVVLRGNRKTSNLAQHAGLCADLVRRPEYKGSSFSQGDATIAQCAAGALLLRDQETMRSIGTSHHVELVTRALDAEAA